MVQNPSSTVPTRRRRRGWSLVALLAVMGILGAACGDDEDAGSSDSSETTEAKAEQQTFAMVTPSAITDKSFSELGYSGLTAGAEAVGAEVIYQENVEVPQAVEAFRNLASQDPVAVIGLGGQFQDAAEEVAPEFPDIQFVVINGNHAVDNVGYYSLAEGELAYLAGVVIGATKEPAKIAQIAGIEIAPIKAQGYGLEQGAGTQAPDVEFTSIFTGDMNDIAKAKEATTTLFDQGAEVVYTSLNEAIAGAEQAATEKGGLLFNNQADKCDEVPGAYYGYTSSAVDLAVEQVVKGISDGSLEPGFADSNLTNPADATEIGLCSGPLDPEVQALVDEAKAKLISGDVKITTP